MKALFSCRCCVYNDVGRDGNRNRLRIHVPETGSSSRSGPMKLERSGSVGVGCRRIDRVAGWVGAGVAYAFFASLERCSCINLSTIENMDEEEDAKDVPLIPVKNKIELSPDKKPRFLFVKKSGSQKDDNLFQTAETSV